MRKYIALLPTLFLCTAAAASAQTNVQVYGVIDAAIEHVTNVNAAGDSLTRMPNITGGSLPSRIGFRGSEDLGWGLKAVFTLENGFAPDSGALGQGNRLFGRQAWVGLAGNWGTITLGRNYTMLFYSFLDPDVIGPSQFSIGSMDGYLPNARSDNSIAYRGTFGGLTVGASYSLGRDASAAGGPSATNCGGEIASDRSACRQWSAMLKYDTSSWGVVGAYDRYNGGPGAIAAFSPTSSTLSDSRAHLGGYVKFGAIKVGGGVLRRNNEGNAATPKSSLPYVGVTYQITPAVVLDAQIARLDVKNSPNRTDLFALRGSYLLSKRTSIYAMYGHIDNNGTAAIALNTGGTAPAGASQNGILAGIRHTF